MVSHSRYKKCWKEPEPMSLRRIFFCACPVIILFITSANVFAQDDAAGRAMQSIRSEAIRADMRFLCDDLLEGRGTGSRGYDIAAKFLAARFEALGLKPAGDNGGFLQVVPFHSMRTDGSRSTLTLIRAGKQENLVFAQDFLVHGDAGRGEVTVEAPIVFVGFGITAPEQNYDD